MRFTRNRKQLHMSFFRCSVALSVVTPHAGTNEVFPLISTTARPRNHVVNRKWWPVISAVLAFESISAKDVFATQLDLLERNAQVSTQADNTWKGECVSHGADGNCGALFHHFGFG